MSKIVDREGLKAFRERLDEKYVIEGEYSPQTSVGLADNLTPYSEDSGTEQSNPFISNGTGTNNNTEIVTVGDYGLLRSKNGNTVCVNQQLQNGNFESTSNWSNISSSFSVSNNIATFTASGQYGRITHQLTPIKGRKYLIKCDIKLTTGTTSVKIAFAGSDSIARQAKATENTTNWQTLFKVVDYLSDAAYTFTQLWIYDERTENRDAIQVKNVNVIDLTQWFNGDIPPDLLNNPSHWSWYQNYGEYIPYNTGTLVNANGVKLVSTGRNQWDEQWEVGGIDDTTGQNVTRTDRIRSKNYIPVISEKTYYFRNPISGAGFYVFYYDKNYNLVGKDLTGFRNTTKTIPSNAKYLRFYVATDYGTTYQNNITISLYYSPEQGGEGYDKYYPYETPYEVNTGNEVLRSVGSVYDYKEPNGTIHRVVGVVDLGTLDWEYSGGVFKCLINSLKVVSDNEVGNILCSKYISVSKTVFNTETPNLTMRSDNNEETPYLYIRDTAYTNATTFKQAMSGVYLYYELATPLPPEQGTSFAENLPINDYGMLYWDSDIPQGNTIFFPINYKGFLDDMYSRVEGDSSKYVIDTELQASETQRDTIDTQLKNAIGGTLRQLLASSKSIDFDNTDFVDLGELSWEYQSTYSRFRTSLSTIKTATSSSAIANILCSKYSSGTQDQTASSGYDKIVAVGTSQYIYIKDSSYTDATAFKNAMKGVLLAYEKA